MTYITRSQSQEMILMQLTAILVSNIGAEMQIKDIAELGSDPKFQVLEDVTPISNIITSENSANFGLLFRSDLVPHFLSLTLISIY